jgi:lipopolysaccharide heptosyltransferase II
MLDFSIYLLYRAGSAVVNVIPLRWLFFVGEAGGFLAWVLLPHYRRLAQRNLTIAFGKEKSTAELRRLGRRHFQRLGANLLCSVKLGNMPLEEVAKVVAFENEDLVHHKLRADQPVVLALSHLSCWELFAPVSQTHFSYARASTIYQSLGNRWIDNEVRRQRGRTGVELFDRREGFQNPISFLRNGGLVAILMDQHAGDHGLWTPFFGRLASTTSLPALLAKRTHAAVMPAAIVSEGRARWRMVFAPRIDVAGDSVAAITAKLNAALEQQIRRAPEDWFWVHNRWKTPKPNFLLSNYKRGIHLPDDSTATSLQPFRILIRGPNWLGDSVISAAAVRAIKRGRPDAHVTIAAAAKLAAVWKLIPEVDEVLPLPEDSLLATVKLLRRQKPFDAAIVFPNSLRSALEVWLAGVPRRCGYGGHSRAWLLNQRVPDRPRLGPIEHQIHHYLHIARHLGATAELAAVPTAVSKNGLGRVFKLGLCAGADYGPAKRWLPERFAEVASAVAGQQPVQWVLFGTAADSEIGKVIAGSLGDQCSNRIGQTSLEDLIAELGECRLLLTNDTGTMHLATLLGVPVVAVFGSTEDRLTGPLGPSIVVRHHVECSPCFLRECPIDFRCMKAISSEEVTARVLKILAKGGPADNSIALPISPA